MQRRLVALASTRAAAAHASAQARHPTLTVQFPMTTRQYARAESRGNSAGELVYLLSRDGLDVSDDEASSAESASDIDNEVFDGGEPHDE